MRSDFSLKIRTSLFSSIRTSGCFSFYSLFSVQHANGTSRARSLRNLLVSGNECGRVFPAGVGPGSPSRDAANWLPSRFSLSVETRRRYGWLRMMVFPGARLFPSPNLGPFGRVAARERQGALSRRAWQYSTIGWVRTRFGEGGGQLDR